MNWKIIKAIRLAAIVLAVIVTSTILSGYGNKQVHPDLNALMVRKFLDWNNKGEYSLPDFKKYTFHFLQGVNLEGRAVVKDGLFSDMDQTAAGVGFGTNLSSEAVAEKSPQQWIIHGGFSADVPEVPASLRHFYDPTQPPGKRYLTDITNAKLMGSLQKYVFTNPQIDGIQWALGKPGDISEGVQDHKYTWEHGKIWIIMALQTANADKRNEYMAGAWRSLGETLHMIADNGCPPHVRNDAHPSPFFNNNTWLGNPDPYEEIIDKIRLETPGVFNTLLSGSPDPVLKERFSKMNTAYQVADSIARFTNANFVTNETISGISRSGKRIRQITHSEKEYSSPKLEDMVYNESDYSYSTKSGIKQCVDHYYAANLIPALCDPFVNEECVKSQAAALFPNILEAGANVIRLFIPKMSVEIKSAANGLVKGEIRHKTDEEYKTEIKYNGEVILLVKDGKFKEIKQIRLQAKNGFFEQPGVIVPEGGRLIAKIDCGGISIESTDFIISKVTSAPTSWVTKKQFRGFVFSIGVMGNYSCIDYKGNKFKAGNMMTYEIKSHADMGSSAEKVVTDFQQKGNVITESWEYQENRNGAFKTYKGKAVITLLSETSVSCEFSEILYFRIHSDAPLQILKFECSVKALPIQVSRLSGIYDFSTDNPCLFLKSLHDSEEGFEQKTLDRYYCVPKKPEQVIRLLLFEKE